MESEPSPWEVQQLLSRLDPQRDRNHLQWDYEGDEDDANPAAFAQTEGGHQVDADDEGDGREGGSEPVERKLTVLGGETGQRQGVYHDTSGGEPKRDDGAAATASAQERAEPQNQ